MGNNCSSIEVDNDFEIPTQQSWKRPDGKKTPWEKDKRKKVSNDFFYCQYYLTNNIKNY